MSARWAGVLFINSCRLVFSTCNLIIVPNHVQHVIKSVVQGYDYIASTLRQMTVTATEAESESNWSCFFDISVGPYKVYTNKYGMPFGTIWCAFLSSYQRTIFRSGMHRRVRINPIQIINLFRKPNQEYSCRGVRLNAVECWKGVVVPPFKGLINVRYTYTRCRLHN